MKAAILISWILGIVTTMLSIFGVEGMASMTIMFWGAPAGWGAGSIYAEWRFAE